MCDGSVEQKVGPRRARVLSRVSQSLALGPRLPACGSGVGGQSGHTQNRESLWPSEAAGLPGIL